MREIMFSILVVALNPGDKLIQTVKSILSQSYSDYQVVIKDGGSTDDSMKLLETFLQEEVPENRNRIHLIRKKDSSIYDGMNQATAYAQGKYYYFLNCGDLLAGQDTLGKVAAEITKVRKEGKSALIYYGNILDALRNQVVQSNPKIDDFACYRNVPCHQACIYHYSLFEERGYKPEFRVRGDYEHFLWSYFKKNANPKYVDVVLASYEGGGFSESKENRKRSAKEHKVITNMYMSKVQLFCYGTILLLTLAPLRTKMAESRLFAGGYQKIKKLLYGRG